MKKLKYFSDKQPLVELIESYFSQLQVDDKSDGKKIVPPTLAGLALHLGFNGKEDIDLYENRGRYKIIIKKARLRVMAYYESRLYCPSPTGAMFALKNMGWSVNPKAVAKPRRIRSINVNLIETGPQPATSEKEAELNTLNNATK